MDSENMMRFVSCAGCMAHVSRDSTLDEKRELTRQDILIVRLKSDGTYHDRYSK